MSLLVFCGAAAGQYTERTFNISGKFTPEQAKWYAVEFEAQKTTVRC
jgi:hypothetical protein